MTEPRASAMILERTLRAPLHERPLLQFNSREMHAPQKPDDERLTPREQSILRRRVGFLSGMMRWLYGLLCLAVAVLLLKDALISGDFSAIHSGGVLGSAALIGATFALTHLGLSRYEGRTLSAARLDLIQGVKRRLRGTLVGLQESAEIEPTRFSVLEAAAAGRHDFVLPTLSDLYRIRPRQLVGRVVEIEFAPNSGIVLALRAAPIDAAELDLASASSPLGQR